MKYLALSYGYLFEPLLARCKGWKIIIAIIIVFNGLKYFL